MSRRGRGEAFAHEEAGGQQTVRECFASTSPILVNGLRVAYRETGRDLPGVPVVVLHGWGCSSESVVSIQRCLETAHPTLAPDLPGFGESDAPPEAWGSTEYAALVTAWLGELGVERASFVGHSFGGKVAIVIASGTPALVERLVLVNSAGIRARQGPSYRARVLAFKTARHLIGAAPLPGKPAMQEWLARRFGSDDYRQAGALRDTLVRVVNEDLQQLLPRIAAPTLLIWGDQDDATPPENARSMEREIPDAGLVTFPGAGHFAYLDDPGRFCRVVGNFLTATRSYQPSAVSPQRSADG